MSRTSSIWPIIPSDPEVLDAPTIKPLLDKPVGVHSRYCDMSWVEENLGWKAKISIEEGMRRVYEAALRKL